MHIIVSLCNQKTKLLYIYCKIFNVAFLPYYIVSVEQKKTLVLNSKKLNDYKYILEYILQYIFYFERMENKA